MKNKIINHLLDIKAIQINTDKLFTWASNIKSPIYIDNRLIISYPEIRKEVTKMLGDLIKEKFKNVDFLAGVSTSGIPHCAYISEYLNLPMGYIRTSKKNHGKQNDIEGEFKIAKNIVIIEDLFSTGKSSLEAYDVLKRHNLNILGIVSIFSYDLPILKKNFENIKHYSLINIKDLINSTIESKKINKKDEETINSFLNSFK